MLQIAASSSSFSFYLYYLGCCERIFCPFGDFDANSFHNFKGVDGYAEDKHKSPSQPVNKKSFQLLQSKLEGRSFQSVPQGLSITKRHEPSD
jgi:hypothetical protein